MTKNHDQIGYRKALRLVEWKVEARHKVGCECCPESHLPKYGRQTRVKPAHRDF